MTKRLDVKVIRKPSPDIHRYVAIEAVGPFVVGIDGVVRV